MFQTLWTTGSRGGNLWFKITGAYPPSGKLQGGANIAIGEWRANENQTVIHGEHPSGRQYTILNEVPPLEVDFESIKWPETWRLPWRSDKLLGPIESLSVSAGLQPSPVPDKAMIALPGGKVSITECADHLFRRIGPSQTIFWRGGALVEPQCQDDGAICLAIIRPAAFQSLIEGFGRVIIWRAGANGEQVLKPTICTEGNAKALMAAKEAAEHLPRISTVVRCPVAIETGGEFVVLAKGYHSENGGLLVTHGETPPQVSLTEAVDAIRGLLDEFEFQSEADKSRALASLITPALKLGNFIPGFVPADVAEADQSQSGKTYRQRIGCAIYNESPTLIAARKGGVGSADESFSQALISGRPFIQFDNVRGRQDSPFVEAFMTADGSFSARVPHRGEVQVDPSRFLILMTSNGAESTRDFANRSSIIRIRKRAGFQYKQYPEGDLLSHVKANQPYYLGCVFSVILDWLGRGKPRTTETRHDFTQWAQTLDWIVQHIFKSAPLLDGHQGAQDRVSNPALSFLRLVALEVVKAGKLGEGLMAHQIVNLCEEAVIEIPGATVGDPAGAARRVGTLMKQAIGAAGDVEVDGFKVNKTTSKQSRPDGGDFDANIYRFSQ